MLEINLGSKWRRGVKVPFWCRHAWQAKDEGSAGVKGEASGSRPFAAQLAQLQPPLVTQVGKIGC